MMEICVISISVTYGADLFLKVFPEKWTSVTQISNRRMSTE